MDAIRLPDIGGALSAIPDIIREPTANPLAALLLLAIASALLLILVIALLLVLTRPHGTEKKKATTPEGTTAEKRSRPASAGAAAPTKAAPSGDASGLSRLARDLAVAILVLFAVWVLGGVTTGSRVACDSCHQDSPHVASESIDSHRSVGCVACHEPGNSVSRAVLNVPARLGHFYAGQAQSPAAWDYGLPVSSSACIGCHRDRVDDLVVNEKRGVRVSHAEPLEAGAECVDCHALASGVVSGQTVGMGPCLRCHDGKIAPAGCPTCHVGDPAQAIRSELPTSGALARVQVPEPGCDGCHDQAREGCDSCHGMRLPHSTQFMRYSHAREGVIDLWTNSGRMCGKCHFPGNRDCRGCHANFLAHGADFRRSHGKGLSYSEATCGCHAQMAFVQGRRFCALCHETRPAGSLP